MTNTTAAFYLPSGKINYTRPARSISLLPGQTVIVGSTDPTRVGTSPTIDYTKRS